MRAISTEQGTTGSFLGLSRAGWLHAGRWVLMIAFVIGLQAVAAACPTCKDGLAQNDPAGQSLVQGYFWSILFMMSMPFLIFSALGGYFYWEIRKARRAAGDSFQAVPSAASPTS